MTSPEAGICNISMINVGLCRADLSWSGVLWSSTVKSRSLHFRRFFDTLIWVTPLTVFERLAAAWRDVVYNHFDNSLKNFRLAGWWAVILKDLFLYVIFVTFGCRIELVSLIFKKKKSCSFSFLFSKFIFK